MQSLDLIIIGAGAAGMMCAITAARRGRRVLLLEHMSEVAKKILISGGGRCNFTNLYASPDQYISQNPHFCKSALARFTPGDFLERVEAHGIQWFEKKLGQLFCESSSRQIVEMLLSECREAGVLIQTGVNIQRVSQTDGHYQLDCENQVYQAPKLVLACGGLSIPKIGATNLGYRLLKQFGHALVETQPGLVPLTYFPEQHYLTELRGVSLPAEVSWGEQSFRENLLFTHFGVSGPAILQISSYWHSGESLKIRWHPDTDWISEILHLRETQPGIALHNHLKAWFPKRFLQIWQERFFESRPLDKYTPERLLEVLTEIQNWELSPAGTSGYAKAEVTTGGADTRYFSSKTFESSKQPGLYCIGELLDVTGWLGGYNFQWAWASGFAAGQAV